MAGDAGDVGGEQEAVLEVLGDAGGAGACGGMLEAGARQEAMPGGGAHGALWGGCGRRCRRGCIFPEAEELTLPAAPRSELGFPSSCFGSGRFVRWGNSCAQLRPVPAAFPSPGISRDVPPRSRLPGNAFAPPPCSRKTQHNAPFFGGPLRSRAGNGAGQNARPAARFTGGQGAAETHRRAHCPAGPCGGSVPFPRDLGLDRKGKGRCEDLRKGGSEGARPGAGSVRQMQPHAAPCPRCARGAVAAHTSSAAPLAPKSAFGVGWTGSRAPLLITGLRTIYRG